jgi:hypothetical protein
MFDDTIDNAAWLVCKPAIAVASAELKLMAAASDQRD